MTIDRGKAEPIDNPAEQFLSSAERRYPSNEQLSCLLPHHLDDLRNSGLSDDTIKVWQCYSIYSDQSWVMTQLGFGHLKPPALALPIFPPDRTKPDLNEVILKPDYPRHDGKGKVIKYETRPRSQNRLHIPLCCREMLGHLRVPIWITEGQKKAEKAAQEGLCCIALPGVWNWLSRISSDCSFPLSDFNLIDFRGREVNIVFDSDCAINPSVRLASRRLGEFLTNREALVYLVSLPEGDDGGKT